MNTPTPTPTQYIETAMADLRLAEGMLRKSGNDLLADQLVGSIIAARDTRYQIISTIIETIKNEGA